MAVYFDLRGTSSDNFKIGKSRWNFDASNATALRQFILGNLPVDLNSGSTGDVLTRGAGSLSFQPTGAAASTPTGSVMDFAGATAPSGWLLCFGQTVSRATYADLFAVIGTTYGVGDGSTTFGIPDARGRTVAGKDNMGGAAANRLTAAGSGINGATLGAAGGLETHTLTTAEMPSHTHTQDSHNHTQSTHNHRQTVVTAGGAAVGSQVTSPNSGSQNSLNFTISTTAVNIATTATNQNTGSDVAHRNVQPTIIFNKIIKI